MNRTVLTVILVVVIVAAIAAVIWTATRSGKAKGGTFDGEMPTGPDAPQKGQAQSVGGPARLDDKGGP